MGLFTKDRPRRRAAESPASQRAARLKTHELVPWAEACLYQIGRNLVDFDAEGDPYALAEAVTATEALGVLVEEIRKRAGEDVGVPPALQ